MKNFFDQYFLKKKKLRNFFYWKKFRFIFLECSKRCPKKSSKGTKNNQEKILSSFRDIPEKEVFSQLFFPENQKLRNFFIGKISDLFFLEYSKTCLKTSTKGTKNNEKKILSSFREIREILAKIFTKKGDFDFGEIF